MQRNGLWLVCALLTISGCTGVGRATSSAKDDDDERYDGGSAIEADASDDTDPPPTTNPHLPAGAEPTLVAKYWRNVTTMNPNGIAGTAVQHQTNGTVYRPRQFDAGFIVTRREGAEYRITDAGPYTGWDVLDTYDTGGQSLTTTRSDYLLVKLNRPATVAVLWYGSTDNLPSWLDDWTLGEPVTGQSGAHPVLRRSFPAGEHYLGSPENRASYVYTVLFAEADGQPSAEPPIAEGKERPTPNTTCPAWVHDLYMAPGPDGETYRIWHPQIDPIYWCYFGHEHGSDPAEFDGFPATQPLFGYTAARANLDEPHEGYKVLVIEERDNDLSTMLLWHDLTGSLRRVCERHYTFDVAFASKSSGEVLARLHFAMDFGVAMSTFGDPAGVRAHAMQPDACPENAEIGSQGFAGRRNIVVQSTGMGYESWQPNWDAPEALPFSGGLTVVNNNPVVVCADDRNGSGIERCNSSAGPVSAAAHGAFRWGTIPGADGVGNFGMDTTSGEWGTFYTDAMGRMRVPASAPGAIEQYAKPGIRAFLLARVTHEEGTDISEPSDFGAKFQVRDPWTALYVPRSRALIELHRNLEDAVQGMN